MHKAGLWDVRTQSEITMKPNLLQLFCIWLLLPVVEWSSASLVAVSVQAGPPLVLLLVLLV